MKNPNSSEARLSIGTQRRNFRRVSNSLARADRSEVNSSSTGALDRRSSKSAALPHSFRLTTANECATTTQIPSIVAPFSTNRALACTVLLCPAEQSRSRTGAGRDVKESRG
jgi:hypothetical protein